MGRKEDIERLGPIVALNHVHSSPLMKAFAVSGKSAKRQRLSEFRREIVRHQLRNPSSFNLFITATINNFSHRNSFKMLRQVSKQVPRALSALTASAARPFISSGTVRVVVVAPAYKTPSSVRGYHEKDKSSSSHLARMDELTLIVLLDHYSNPRNVGSMAKGDMDVGTGLVGAPACGDVMKLQIRVDPNTNTIADVKFKTFGCGSAIASSSYLTELVRGMSLEQASKIRNTEIAKELCLPPVKLHCSMLAEDAIKSAISNYYTKNPKAKATDLGSAGAAMPKVEIETVNAEQPQAAMA